jgi:hypothetical protein
LEALDGRFARAEVVASQLKKTTAGLNTGFRYIAVRFTWFAIATVLETKLVDNSAGECRSKRTGKCCCARHAVARVFFSAQRPAVFIVIAREILLIETNGQVVGVI